MPRFFLPATAVIGDSCRITGPDAAHLARSLRVRRGERLLVVAGTYEHGIEVTGITREAIEGRVTWSRPAEGEPALRVEVLQAIPRAGMDEAVENLSEVGAAAIRPVYTERTVVRPEPARHQQRTERWRSIARNAAGLAFRGAPPQVHHPVPLAEALAGHRGPVVACAFEVPVIPATALRLRPVAPGESVALAIGPEGGWGAHDLALLAEAGATFVHLGPRVLRVRLAGAVALGLLLAGAGELETAYAVPPVAAAAMLNP